MTFEEWAADNIRYTNIPTVATVWNGVALCLRCGSYVAKDMVKKHYKSHKLN